MTAVTGDIVTEFCAQIDVEKEYGLKELKQILSDIYKTKTVKPKQVKKTAKVVSDTESDDEKPKKRGRPSKQRLDKDGNEKQKRAPSGYNIFVKQRIQQLKSEQPDTPAKDLMKMAAAEWKTLDKHEQEQYKVTE